MGTKITRLWWQHRSLQMIFGYALIRNAAPEKQLPQISKKSPKKPSQPVSQGVFKQAGEAARRKSDPPPPRLRVTPVFFRLSGRNGDAAARNETRILMASPTLPQAIKRHISLCATPCVPGETHKTIITPLRGRVFVSGKAEECLGRAQCAATCHRYLVRPCDIVTRSVSHRSAAAPLAGIKKKSKGRFSSAGFPPKLTARFDPRLISRTKPFRCHEDM